MRSSDHDSSNSRLGAKGWFLTYPKCPLTKEDFLSASTAFSPHSITEYVICCELHQDSTPHLHAFIKFSSKVFLDKKMTRFDFLGHHGNYQVAKCWKAVQSYCRKGGDYISNINIESALEKKSKKSVDILTRDDLRSLVLDGTISALQLPATIKARHAFQLLDEPQDQPGMRGIWIHGPAGVGKSYYVRKKEKDLYLKSQNKWWDGYKGQPAVLLDDFDKKGECLSHYLKIWPDLWACTGEAKGSIIPLNYRWFYITSNYSIDQLFPALDDLDLNQAIHRRFKSIHMLEKNLNLGYPKRSLSVPRERSRSASRTPN